MRKRAQKHLAAEDSGASVRCRSSYFQAPFNLRRPYYLRACINNRVLVILTILEQFGGTEVLNTRKTFKAAVGELFLDPASWRTFTGLKISKIVEKEINTGSGKNTCVIPIFRTASRSSSGSYSLLS